MRNAPIPETARTNFLKSIEHTMRIGGEAIIQYLGWDLRWTGWRQPPHMIIEFGVWIATKRGDPRIFYSTTLGVCDLLHGGEYGTMDPTIVWTQHRHSALTTEQRFFLSRNAALALSGKLESVGD